MNIVIIGPGNDPKRIGTFFVNSAISKGHNVLKFSYRLENESFEEIMVRFEKEISIFDKIDVFYYNSIGGFYPGQPGHYSSNHKVEYTRWQEGIMINGAMPHALSLKCLSKMDKSSSVVFMTSSGSYLVNRDNYLDLAGYFGTKGALNHLMRALAEHNSAEAKVCVLAPHIPYGEEDAICNLVMRNISDKILNILPEDNGKVIQCFPPEGRLHYYEGGVQ